MSDATPRPVSDAAGGSRLVVPVAELTRRIGTRRTYAIDTHLSAPEVAGVRVRDDIAVTGEVSLESVVDGIVATGTLAAPWAGQCRRCLDDITGTVEIDVHEVFSPNPVPGETYPIEGDHIDLNALVHDAVVLSLPLTPVCRSDCQGPDPERFPALVASDDTGPAAATGDPRWAALAELRFDDEG